MVIAMGTGGNYNMHSDLNNHISLLSDMLTSIFLQQNKINLLKPLFDNVLPKIFNSIPL